MKREQIKSLIKSHYLMITRLETLLDEEPVSMKKKTCPADKVIDLVNEAFNTECRENTRRKRVVFARHCAAYLLREYTNMTLVDISNSLGNTDHATCSHSIKTAKNLIETDEDYANKVAKIRLILEDK
jgi:chromosomal replication initiation ATPase DnaA